MLRDITRGKDAQVASVIATIVEADADVLVLQGIDHDLKNAALNALAEALAAAGADYPVRFALRPNSGMQSGLDLDGNGRTGEARDAQGYGDFSGQGGMAILSRLPLGADVVDFSGLLWRDLPGARLPVHPDGAPFPSPEAQAVQRLSNVAHWAVPVEPPGAARFWLLAWHATPPVFDGPEDRNGLRNHDETALWLRYLEGALPRPAPERFVIAGVANADPVAGEAEKAALHALLAHPGVQDPLPGQPTVDWSGLGLGQMRVDYVLPSASLRVIGAGMAPAIPAPPSDGRDLSASRHRLVWVDLAL